MEDRVAGQQTAPYLDEVLLAVTRGATVLTPGRRAASRLARQVDVRAAEHGQGSWRAARILPWAAWVSAHWDSALLHGADTKVVLNRVQELALWQKVILEDGSTAEQSALDAARLCAGAANLLETYAAGRSFHNRTVAVALSNDAALFHRWYLRYQHICGAEGYLPFSATEAELSILVQQRRVHPEAEILLFGFPDVSPSREMLLEALRQRGTAVRALNADAAPGTPAQYLQYVSSAAELQACVRWVKDRLTVAPQQTVAIVVPDLAAVRPALERELRMAISPGSANLVDAAPAAYEIAAGLPLQSVPLVRDALLLLRWCTERLPLEDVAFLLRSSSLTLAETREAGASLETDKLHKQAPLTKELSLRQTTALLRPHPASQRLMRIERQAAELRSSATFASFTGQVQTLLQLSGWPGRAPLDAEEMQASEAWQRALDAVASLDLFGQKTTWAAFLHTLQTHVRTYNFVPAERGMPVQVTGVEEALGSPADALWFLHAEAGTWPTQAAPNALLPLALQREFGMPGMDGRRDEDAAAARLQQLLHSTAGDIRLSCSGSPEGDAGRPSPVAERVLSAMGVALTTAPEALETEENGPQLETLFDSTPLPALPNTEVSGGVSILTAQAQCGFRAWAEKRLFANPLDEVTVGLTPRERGDQVHAILQAYWKATGTQQALRAQRLAIGADGLSERDRLLQDCIARVCETRLAEGWDEAYLAVQKQRLFRLLAAWLDYEATRPPFEVVQMEQETRDVPVGPLRLHMRVDRIDRVLATEGSSDALGTLLIDYKTGNKANSPKEWSSDRPEQPQLPVYATAAVASAELGTVSGIAFATIRAGTNNMQLHGLAEAGLLPPSRQKSGATFRSEQEEWRRHLEALAQAFADGSADVAPKSFPRTCDTCGQRLLCRLDAATLLKADGDGWDNAEPEAE